MEWDIPLKKHIKTLKLIPFFFILVVSDALWLPPTGGHTPFHHITAKNRLHSLAQCSNFLISFCEARVEKIKCTHTHTLTHTDILTFKLCSTVAGVNINITSAAGTEVGAHCVIALGQEGTFTESSVHTLIHICINKTTHMESLCSSHTFYTRFSRSILYNCTVERGV